MPKTRIPSPSRSQGSITPRRNKPRKSRSVCSPAPSNASGRLTSLIDQFKEKNMESFSVSPMKSRWSVLTDNTDIDEPQRKSWWKNLNENSQDFNEVLDDNKATDSNNPIEDISDIEVISQENKNYSSLDLPESSDNESIQSIVITQRKLFTQKENKPQKKFGQIIGARETLTKMHKSNTTFHEKTITAGTRDLFQGTKKTKPVFTTALLNITANKTTVNKTTENIVAEPQVAVKNIFGNRPAKKRKNIFADFIVSDSEHEVSDIQVEAKHNLVKRSKNDKIVEDKAPQGPNTDNKNTEKVNQREVDNQKANDDKECEDDQISENIITDDLPYKSPELKQAENKYRGLVDTRETMDKLQPTNITHDEVQTGTKTLFQNKESNTIFSSTLLHISPNKTAVAETKTISKDIFGNRASHKQKNIFANFLESESEHEISEIVPEKEVSIIVETTDTKLPKNHSRTLTNADTDPADEHHQANMSQLNTRKENREQIVENNQEGNLNELENENESEDEEMKYEESDEEIPNKNTVNNVATSASEKEVSESNENQDNHQNSGTEQIAPESSKIISNKDEKNEKSRNEGNKSKTNEKPVSYTDTTDGQLGSGNKTSVNASINKSNKSRVIENESNENLETNENIDANEAVVIDKMFEQNEQEEMEVDNNKLKDDGDVEKNSNSITDQNEATDDKNEAEHDAIEEDAVAESEEEVENEESEIDYEESEEENALESEQDNENQASEDENDGAELHAEATESDNDEKTEIEDGNHESEANAHEDSEINDDVNQENEFVNDENEQSKISDDENELDDDNEGASEENEIEDEEEHVESDASDDENVESKTNDEHVDNETNDEVDSETNDDENEQNGDNENSESDDGNEENLLVQSRVISSDDVIDESPNVTHDTTGKNRKKIKSPEIVLHDKTQQQMSFIAKGRNTSVREAKTMYKDLDIRPSFAPPRDSLGLSTANSSAEGSGWDSHRTTRKTLRQTFGKDFTPRKSLRALVLEKSAKQNVQTLQSDTVLMPQANSTEFPQDSNCEVDSTIESDHEVSKRTRQTTLEAYLEKVKQQNIEKKLKMEHAIRNSLKGPSRRDTLSLFKIPTKPAPRKPKPTTNKPKKQPKSSLFDELPSEVIEDMKYKPPKRFQPSNASWITKRLYKYLENKLEAKYDYKARVRAEKLVETIYHFAKDVRRHEVAPTHAVDVLKHELARLEIVTTHFEFYEFFHEFMPREVRVKVVPDIVNKIPLPRHGVFSDILRGTTVQG